MTESEIMKALEICSQNDTNKHYMMTYRGMPLHILFEATLALINRKNAECKECGIRTSECIEKLQKQIAEKDAEIEKVRTELDRLTIYFDEAVEAKLETARAEAIKEFAERVKRKAKTHFPLHNEKEVYSSVRVKYIDQIAKEMGVEL